MRMKLLHDILTGLQALEKQQASKPIITKKANSNQFGKLIRVTRRGPAGEPVTSDPYAVDYPPHSYDYDPDKITFFRIDIGSPEHMSKLDDFDIIAKSDPTTAHKILTLA